MNIMNEFIEDNIDTFTKSSSSVKNWDFEGMNNEFLESLSIDISNLNKNTDSIDSLKKDLKHNMHEVLNYKKESMVPKFLRIL